ncbi:hypothetical protein Agub_g8427 [Astrephomene gubernaculifera]|uniref:Uncharacterized protein n=1 Tax=Astrephomene gubernaculifera TaxID=47775 RepID=A0AAD3DRM7_9CHLO|nr:hypothetical protein Agub_g8427 [Astrephomene gubernaculifera]
MVAPRWPKGPVPWIALFGMATGIAGAFFPATRTWPVIQQIFAFGTTLFRSAFGLQVVMGGSVVAHLVETAFTLRICAKNKVSPGHTLGWIGYTVLIGYVAIHELKRCLKQAK